MSLFSILYLIAILFVVPFIFLLSLWKGKFSSKLEWLMHGLFTMLFMIWIFFAGAWDWVGFYFRYAWIILLLVAIFLSWKKVRSLPFRIPFNKGQIFSMGISVVLILLFTLYNSFVFSSYFTKDDPIELSFPLKDGAYYVGHGGNHVQMNYHNAYESQKYALDIAKLNTLGTRANGIYPKEFDKYAIYGAPLYSPCDGEVLEARNHLPDQVPPKSDPDNAFGNYIALKCVNSQATIYIAHMQKDSLVVNEGKLIHAGDKIGAVGNSGNTSEPHLHIHAEKDGKGVPIHFEGKFLVRNNVVR